MKRPILFVFLLFLLLLAVSLSLYRAKRPGLDKKPHPPSKQAKVLYWYDPMRPDQHFDKPGKSPYMDMDLVPKLADEEKTNASVKIDPSAMQNLGVRLAKVEGIALSSRIEVSGMIGFDERDVAIVQSRANGFVVKVPPLAPGDVVHKGEALVVLSVPEWSAAQGEFLAAQGDPALVETARERLRLSGIPQDYISETEKTGKANLEFVLRSPVSGVVQSLDIRTGMNVSPGQTLVRINGLSTVWLDAAVPQALSGEVHVGDKIEAMISGLPEKAVPGRVETVLPVLSDPSRSLRVRIAFPNQDLKLRPGDSAQVRIGHMTDETALAVPTEAVIRTGKRSLVMVSDGKGRFVPAEVVPGQEIGDRTVILSGLEEGQKIASSGQFLIDSEASLSGIMARSSAPASASGNTDETDATIMDLSGKEITLRHGPFKAFNMPGMTMTFPLADPDVANGLKSGDRVHVTVRKTDQGMVVEKMGKMGGMP